MLSQRDLIRYTEIFYIHEDIKALEDLSISPHAKLQVAEIKDRIEKLDRQITSEVNEQIAKYGDEFIELDRQLATKLFHCALLRVNLTDECYYLQRVIDGDTIVLSLPSSLKVWEDAGIAKDIRIRLYGVDTPEINDKYGKEYKSFVSGILENVDDGRMAVIWERELSTSIYSEYPRVSFERGIGNIFVRAPAGLIYLNSLLAMMPQVSTKRNEKPLIRGERILREEIDLQHEGYRHSLPLSYSIPEISEISERSGVPLTGDEEFSYHLTIYSTEMLHLSSPIGLWKFFNDQVSLFIGLDYKSIISNERLEYAIFSRRISPFDLPLILASDWLRSNDIQ